MRTIRSIQYGLSVAITALMIGGWLAALEPLVNASF